MFKTKKTLKILSVLILGFFIASLFSLKVSVKTLVAQTNKYTVFKTENAGFKFYQILGNQRFWAPLFAQTPTTTSDKNQVATKEYVDSKIVTGEMDIRYYNSETCRNPSEEMVIGGTDRDAPYIGGDPSASFPSRRETVNQETQRLIYSGRDFFIRKYPVGLENTKWVACLKIPSNPAVGYVVTPGDAVDYSPSNAKLKIGSCDFTESYDEYSKGLIRNFFKRPCSWSIWRSDRGYIKIKSTKDLSFLRNLKKSIKTVTLDLYSNDGGYCLARFKTPENFKLELAITRSAYINVPNVTLESLPSNFDINSSNLILYGDYAGYSQVGPLVLGNSSFNFSGNWSYKIFMTSKQDSDWYIVRGFKPIHMLIDKASDFWNLVHAIDLVGETYNGPQWGVNICKLTLWFE